MSVSFCECLGVWGLPPKSNPRPYPHNHLSVRRFTKLLGTQKVRAPQAALRTRVIQQRAGKGLVTALRPAASGCIVVTTNAVYKFERAVTCDAKEVS